MSVLVPQLVHKCYSGGDVNDRGGCACMGAVGLWKISVASS